MQDFAESFGLAFTLVSTIDPDLVEMWGKHDAIHPGIDGKNYLTKEFVDNFDLVIVNLYLEIITE